MFEALAQHLRQQQLAEQQKRTVNDVHRACETCISWDVQGRPRDTVATGTCLHESNYHCGTRWDAVCAHWQEYRP